MDKVLFREEQKFSQRWLWMLLIPVTLISTLPFIYCIFLQVVAGKHCGNHSGSISDLVVVLFGVTILMSGIIWLVAKMKLIVEISEECIRYRYPPIIRKWKLVGKSEIESFKVRKYNPITEYGGWGIKGSRRNKALNATGNIGLQLYLTDGRKILFGTQKKQAIESAIKKMMQAQ